MSLGPHLCETFLTSGQWHANCLSTSGERGTSMRSHPRKQSGFTLVEVIISTCIVAILASIAISSTKDYSRRARLSETVMATSACKAAVSEGYPVRDVAPPANGWGCEQNAGNTHYAGPVQTSPNGVIRVSIVNLDAAVNGRYIYLIPARGDAVTPLTGADFGTNVR